MMTKDADKKREQMMMFSMDDMVPKDHICFERSIVQSIGTSFMILWKTSIAPITEDRAWIR